MEWDTIFIQLSTQMTSDFSNLAQFVDSLKHNYIRFKEIGIKDVPDWQFTIWPLHGLDLEYNSFYIILNNSRKADQTEELKTEPKFDFILEQILNLDSQRKISKARFMKISSKFKDKKKNLRDLCLYCSRPSHIEEKSYYKYPKYASQNFWERFKDWILKL